MCDETEGAERFGVVEDIANRCGLSRIAAQHHGIRHVREELPAEQAVPPVMRVFMKASPGSRAVQGLKRSMYLRARRTLPFVKGPPSSRARSVCEWEPIQATMASRRNMRKVGISDSSSADNGASVR